MFFRNVPILYSQSQSGLGDFVESIFIPVLQTQHNVDDISYTYINQSLKGRGNTMTVAQHVKLRKILIVSKFLWIFQEYSHPKLSVSVRVR